MAVSAVMFLKFLILTSRKSSQKKKTNPFHRHLWTKDLIKLYICNGVDELRRT